MLIKLGITEFQGRKEILEGIDGQVGFEAVAELKTVIAVKRGPGKTSVNEKKQDKRAEDEKFPAVGDAATLCFRDNLPVTPVIHPAEEKHTRQQAKQHPDNRVGLLHHFPGDPEIFHEIHGPGIKRGTVVRITSESSREKKENNKSDNGEGPAPPFFISC